MKAYLNWVTKSFQRGMAYRLEYYMSVMNAVLYIFIFTSIWAAVLPEGKEVAGLDRALMIQYAIYATLIKVSVSKGRDMLGPRVRSGEIAVDLTKPLSLPGIVLADSMGNMLFQTFSRALPLLVLSILFFDLSLPPGLDLYFILSFVLSFLIFYSLMLFIGVSSFFLTDNFAVWVLNSGFVSLLSGAIIPLEILPDSLAALAKMTPYPYLFYLPTMKLLRGDFPMQAALVKQLIAFLATFGISYGIYALGRRNLHLQGG